MRLFAVVLLAWYLALSVTPQPQPVPAGMGASIGWQRGDAAADTVMDKLHPPVIMNWLADDWCMATPECMPMVYSARNLEQYVPAANDQPERMWLLVSEPNCCGTNDSPAHVATFVRAWEAATDNPYACCGVVLWDGMGWRDWLQGYLDSGGPKTPYCHAHLFSRYAYPHVTALREWLDAHDWPCQIILSEVADPWGPVVDNMALMTEVARLVADGTVQAAIWYSADPYGDYHGLWPDTGLFANGGQLTALGARWLALQPGGANWPGATAEPGPTATGESHLYLPTTGRGE